MAYYSRRFSNVKRRLSIQRRDSLIDRDNYSIMPTLAQPSSLTDEEIIFTVSVDVEESWDWTKSLPVSDFDTKNAEQLQSFHEHLNAHDIAATYFCTYAMLHNTDSRDHLVALSKKASVEMAAHLHPWCNPPFTDSTYRHSNQSATADRDSYLIHLPQKVIEEKVAALVNKFTECFGRAPYSFRSGRWGCNDTVLRILQDRGFKVDSSLLAFYKTPYFDCGTYPSQPHYFEQAVDSSDRILSMPASGGYSRRPFSSAHRWHIAFQNILARFFHLSSLASKLRFQRQIFLSPELSSLEHMKALCDQMLKRDDRFFHLSLHSSSLEPGHNQYVHTEQEKQKLLDNITGVLDYLRQRRRVHTATLEQASAYYGHKAKHTASRRTDSEFAAHSV